MRLLICLLVLCALLAPVLAANPAILILSPQGAGAGWVDLDYLKELQQQGVEVDYTNSFADVTWERIKQYNALVIYMTPDAFAVTNMGQRSDPPRVAQFTGLVDKYLASGGGVFLLAPENNMGKQMVAELTDRWGAKLPVELIDEQDKAKIAPMTHNNQATPLAFTEQIFPSPVSQGVKQIWYPLFPAYNGGMGGPLSVDEQWTVVVKASKTAVTKPIDTSQSTSRIANEFKRTTPVPEPPLFAIREVGGGRVALMHHWQQFSIGSGTKWIYNREVLDRGLNGKPSDFGLLLQNTFRWLAAPSLKSGALGGFVTKPEQLQPPNQRPENLLDYAETKTAYDLTALKTVTVPPALKLYRGLIGARSQYSSGAGTVAEYAKAAQQAGLDFVVFLEDFDKLTPQKLEALATECRQNSSATLLLLPGFNIRNNIGDHMFFYSPDPVWLPDLVLTGKDKKTLYIQEVNDKGQYTGYITPFLDWVLGAYHVEKGQVGYYDFASAPHGQRMHDLKLYAAAGIRYYKGGKLVEDNTADYLVTAMCTIPPAPVSINEVNSPAELLAEARSGHALTYGQAASLDAKAGNGLFMSALRWTHQYDSAPVFTSDGPLILAWTGCWRVWTLGAEEFVTSKNIMYAPIKVTAAKGLKSISIYNGAQLFRRFACGGKQEFAQTLVLDATIHRDLVLIAEDMAGGKAVSFARRCWKDGALAPSFCSDHVNDGGMCSLAHGPISLPFNRIPPLSYNLCGDTWDGGPTGVMPLAGNQNTLPVLETNLGKEDANRMEQIPILEYDDEGVLAVANQRQELYDPGLLNVVNPWHTYGPIAGPTQQFTNRQRLRLYVTRTVGQPDTGWAAPGIREGVNPSLFTDIITIKNDCTVKSLLLGSLQRNANGYLVIGTAAGTQTVDMAASEYPEFQLKLGEWFGFYAKHLGNAQLFINRGDTLTLRTGGGIELYAAMKEQPLKKGDTYTFELSVLGFPLNMEISGAADLQRYVAYLQAPQGMQLTRGTRLDTPGLLELTPSNGAVELSIPKPAADLNLALPVRLEKLNPRWSAGLFQKAGYSKGYYGPGKNRYRALGIDFDGHAYLPLYIDAVPTTAILAGHPLIAGPEGRELFIQVTKMSDAPPTWHIAVNNPTDHAITTTLKQAMNLPGLDFPEQKLTLQAGEYVVLR